MDSVWMQVICAAAFVTLVIAILLWLRAADRSWKGSCIPLSERNCRRRLLLAGHDFVQTAADMMQTVQGQLEGVCRANGSDKAYGAVS